MRPFIERPGWGQCPKCEQFLDEWEVAYHEAAHADYFGMGTSYPQTRSEHLCWSCPRCGYAVQTLPADVARLEAS